VTIISPGFVRTDFAEGVTNPEVKAQLAASRDKFVMPPDAIARAIAFAIEQPADIDVNEIVNSLKNFRQARQGYPRTPVVSTCKRNRFPPQRYRRSRNPLVANTHELRKGRLLSYLATAGEQAFSPHESGIPLQGHRRRLQRPWAPDPPLVHSTS
jgi:hypothetical protein